MGGTLKRGGSGLSLPWAPAGADRPRVSLPASPMEGPAGICLESRSATGSGAWDHGVRIDRLELGGHLAGTKDVYIDGATKVGGCLERRPREDPLTRLSHSWQGCRLIRWLEVTWRGDTEQTR
ncbi:hypothetical protein KSP39_PZI011687 [Platanthera zijinensis]|uniref:Uncharacterized protein n=1 Tax=Platanthera zijinensis TaxID=2320716 RepID=A0AAP0BH86_9ASPA